MIFSYSVGMGPQILTTPEIRMRNQKIGAKPVGANPWYMGGDPVASTFFNALTITFPLGEQFFIESVKLFRDGTPDKLRAEIADFIKQEALHTREHVAFNAQVENAGYDTEPLYDRVRHELGRFRKRSEIRQLGLTIALEHFTALLARELLEFPHHLESAPESVRQLWRWHALEEIEHKGVAYDTFLFATRDWSGLNRWRFRSIAMLGTSYQFAKVVWANMAAMYQSDGLQGWRVTWRTLNFLLGHRGIVRAMTPGWLSWFLPGFHPWKQDDRELIKPVAAEFAESMVK